jgi:hypothetical protein
VARQAAMRAGIAKVPDLSGWGGRLNLTKRFIVPKGAPLRQVEETAPLPPAKKHGWWPFARE